MLEVLIGLAIIFLVLSVLVAGIQELIASLFQWRARHLQKSILQMMTKQFMPGGSDPAAITLLTSLYQNDLVQSMNHYLDAWLPSLWRKSVEIVSNKLSIAPRFKTRSSHKNVNNAHGPQRGQLVFTNEMCKRFVFCLVCYAAFFAMSIQWISLAGFIATATTHCDKHFHKVPRNCFRATRIKRGSKHPIRLAINRS
jgi:hypothetical protein